MTDFHFDRYVSREDLNTVKEWLIPEEIRKALSDNGLISYRGAEFEFPTCPAFSEGIRKAADNGLYAFTPPSDRFYERITWWVRRIRGYDLDPAWLMMTHGTIYAVAEAIRLLVPPDGSILVLSPHYTRYDQAAVRQDRNVHSLQLVYEKDGRYRIDFQSLERVFASSENDLLIITNPNNPTGTIWSEEDLKRVAGLSEKYKIPVLSDEIFADVTLSGQSVLPYVLAAEPSGLAMSVISWGKTLSLTGMNHACVIIRNPVLRERFRQRIYADHYGSIDPLLYAGLMHALNEDGMEFVLALRNQIGKNAALMRDGLQELFPGVRIRIPEGGYVLWADYRALGYDDHTLKMLLTSCLLDGDEGSEYAASDQFYRYNLSVPSSAIEKSLEYIRKRKIHVS